MGHNIMHEVYPENVDQGNKGAAGIGIITLRMPRSRRRLEAQPENSLTLDGPYLRQPGRSRGTSTRNDRGGMTS